MIQTALDISSSMNPSDMTLINNGITNIVNIINNANVNFTQATYKFIPQFLSDLLNNNDLPPSFDPSSLLSDFGTDGTLHQLV